MRPKFVILFFVAIFGVLGIVVAFKRNAEKTPTDSVGQTSGPDPTEVPTPGATKLPVVQANPNSSNTAAILEQLRVAEVEKELDQIRELESEGAGSETIPMILLAKVTHPEGEVRKAALYALKHLDATNAVPGLEQAVALIKDPREKVIMMDVIDYLKLPALGSDVPPATNDPAVVTPRATSPRLKAPNPNLQPGAGNRGRGPNQPRPPVAPPSVDQVQPATPTPQP